MDLMPASLDQRCAALVMTSSMDSSLFGMNGVNKDDASVLCPGISGLP